MLLFSDLLFKALVNYINSQSDFVSFNQAIIECSVSLKLIFSAELTFYSWRSSVFETNQLMGKYKKIS